MQKIDLSFVTEEKPERKMVFHLKIIEFRRTRNLFDFLKKYYLKRSKSYFFKKTNLKIHSYRKCFITIFNNYLNPNQYREEVSFVQSSPRYRKLVCENSNELTDEDFATLLHRNCK
jgi:hypothetical protein